MLTKKDVTILCEELKEVSLITEPTFQMQLASLRSPAVKLVGRLCYALKQTLPIYVNKYQINTQYQDILF